ncbi:RdgB/HAM1 family non-canonical purine NTP pyrophosphatase [Candidatus Pelagibacter sp.]|nr:RdgB/HAM1 family non-canonical purine NTP pyrophosphatase [Candidatus Pelagibacter sp.]|tara:strand:- start:635 stop:1237 length:603 start_codon:yes stop_codon:yes gene_type:complete
MKKKKIINLFIGSNNRGKIKEIRDLLPKTVKILTPKHLNLNSPKETGKTFQENSLIKAKFFSKKAKMICLADDSGLEIDSLNRLPGIYSARWGGKKSNFNLAIKRVYKELKKNNINWYKSKQTARFICALTIYWPNNKFINVIGKVEGSISKFKKGKNGFGYDPIFIPVNKKITFGEMKPKVKYKIDHRMKAFKKIKKFF